MNVQPQHVSASLTELAGEGSIPVLSSPRRSHLAFLRVGSAACGNTELKVRHKYGAKRVFKLVIRADFFSQCCLFFSLFSRRWRRGGEEKRFARDDPPVRFMQSGVHVHRAEEWKRGEASK